MSISNSRAWGDKIISLFRKKIETEPFYGTSEEMIDETNRILAKLTKEKKQKKTLVNDTRKLLK